jgi:tRNA dimethylallyltransferase
MTAGTSPMVCILGPTASGKSALAVEVARELGGEVISADSRQVYRGMDIGTGKDRDLYGSGGSRVVCHLVDIVDVGEPYSVFRFQQDFVDVYNAMHARGVRPVLCGGSGLYLESILLRYRMSEVPRNDELRADLEAKDMPELVAMLEQLRALHNRTDTVDRARLERAIEIAVFERDQGAEVRRMPEIATKVFGVRLAREQMRERVTRRLRERLADGMIEEVQALLARGVEPGQLRFYGLEYRYVTEHVAGDLSRDDMFRRLNTAIHRFAKRQETWFRRMERRGVEITWLDGERPLEANREAVCARSV